VEFRELDISERHKVNEFYQRTTYKRPVSGSDRVFVAEKSGSIYGAVRIETFDGVQVLRGMYMHPEHVRKGIGRELLQAIEPVLAQTDSFCIPRDHLFDFYGRAGFRYIEPEAAPTFLHDRLQGYLNEGIPVAILYRPVGQAA
jgi:GNAT superfamily N-acetyltransferase